MGQNPAASTRYIPVPVQKHSCGWTRWLFSPSHMVSS